MKNRNWKEPTRYIALVICLILLAGLVVYFRVLIRPLILAGLLAYLLYPVVRWLTKSGKISHRSAVSVVYIVTLLLLGAIPAAATPIVINQVQALELDVLQLIDDYQSLISTPVTVGNITFYPNQVLPDISGISGNILPPIAGGAFRLVEILTINFAWVLVVLVVAYYLLKDWDVLRDWLFKIPPEEYLPDVQLLYRELSVVWADYIRSQLLFMLAVGVLDTIAWLAIGLPGAVILGFITGVTSIVPELGAFVSGALAVLVALIEGSSYLPITNFWFAILVLLVYFVITNVKNIWIRPIIIGRSVHVHEGVVFVVVLAALMISGPLAAFLSVPLLVSLMVIGRYLRRRILGLPPFPEQNNTLEDEGV